MTGIGYKRPERVGDLILKEISEMILKGEIKDPRVSSVNLTGIKVTDDLGFARKYFTLITNKAEREEALSGLQSAPWFNIAATRCRTARQHASTLRIHVR